MRNWITRRPLLSFCLASAVWVYVLYSGALSAPFVYDDTSQVVNNPDLQSWHTVYIHYILAPVSFTSRFLGSGGSTYRPLFLISLAVDHHLWGANAAGFHLTNLFLHWLNGLLLFQLLRKLHLSTFVAGLAALVWLGLPINSEAIAWISARAYPLSTAFMLLALLAALAYVRNRRWPSLVAFTALAIMADFTHEQGVLLVAFIALLYLLEPAKDPKPWITLGLISLLADLLYSVCKYSVCKFAAVAPAAQGDRTLWSVGLKFWTYIQLISFPVHMSAERSSAVPANALSPIALIAWAALIGLAATAFLLRNRAPSFAAGLAALLLALLPYCGFVYIYQGMAERFAYLPAIGFVIVVVTAGTLAKPLPRRVLLGCLALWVAWGAWRLTTRVHDWQQPLALYRNSLEATPRSAYLEKDLGDLYAAQGSPRQALTEYTKSLSFTPDDPNTIMNYGAVLQQTGNRSEAAAQYKRVIALQPRDSTAYVNLEGLYIEEGRLDDAIATYKQAISVNPNDAKAYFDMGVMFQQREQGREALAFYKKVLQLKPGDPQTLLNLSKLPLVEQ
jgi:protein O-mannosyl-transferase